MELRASAEVYQPAHAALDKVRRIVVPFLNAAFAASSLAALQCKLRYIPIVMPESMHMRYPARSKLRKKELLFDCAPLLNYDVFVSGSFDNQLREYLRGINLSSLYLAALGATTDQVEEFNAILASAADRILFLKLDQTLH